VKSAREVFMKRLQVIPNGPPKAGSDLPVPDWAKPASLRVPVKPKDLTPVFSQPLDGAIPEIPRELSIKTLGVLSATLIISVAMVAILQHLMR
jgi:hypothetical protein